MPWDEPSMNVSNPNKRPRSTLPPNPTTVPVQPVRSHKKRKADSDEAEDTSLNKNKPISFGVGMVKGREDEWGEPADVQTKIDFNELPDETLYRYLELHDLLPRWTASPWSEDPCTPPNALYTLAPPLPSIPIVPEGDDQVEPDPNPTPTEPKLPNDKPESNLEESTEDGSEDVSVAPTTRSKTAPHRKAHSPNRSPSPTVEIKRGVITLSDVAAARSVLAEKANAHWVKGLGGGQNKEGETIVQFLYKMKVGPGRLLRVYNPYPPPFAY